MSLPVWADLRNVAQLRVRSELGAAAGYLHVYSLNGSLHVRRGPCERSWTPRCRENRTKANISEPWVVEGYQSHIRVWLWYSPVWPREKSRHLHVVKAPQRAQHGVVGDGCDESCASVALERSHVRESRVVDNQGRGKLYFLQGWQTGEPGRAGGSEVLDLKSVQHVRQVGQEWGGNHWSRPAIKVNVHRTKRLDQGVQIESGQVLPHAHGAIALRSGFKHQVQVEIRCAAFRHGQQGPGARL